MRTKTFVELGELLGNHELRLAALEELNSRLNRGQFDQPEIAQLAAILADVRPEDDDNFMMERGLSLYILSASYGIEVPKWEENDANALRAEGKDANLVAAPALAGVA